MSDEYIRKKDVVNLGVMMQTHLWTREQTYNAIFCLPSADVEPVRHEEDGTLWVTVGDCEKVGRVIVKNEREHFCRVFYMGDGDEEPVRHGRWLEYGENKDGTHNIRCSKCGAGLKSKGHANSYYTKHKYRYCNNCGARMDGEDDEID